MKIIDAIKSPRKILFSIGMHGWIHFLRDETYLKLMYWCKFAKKLDLSNPKTFNEKIQWMKLNYRKPEFTFMVDKYEAKKYAASVIGEEFIVPTLGVWNSFDEIDFEKLPKQFVLKCTHDSGGLVICRDKASFNRAEAKKKIEKCLKRNYYWVGREWPYKNVKPRIIAEQYMEDVRDEELRDYKFFVFDGVVKALFITKGRAAGDTQADYYDVDFNHLDLKWGYPNSKVAPKKPETFDKMLSAAEKIAQGHPQLRVDFYEVNGKAYFGEMTFYDGSGFDKLEPETWDEKFGEWIALPPNMPEGRSV